MPPKIKYTKEDILNAALEIARERGIEAVMAREVGKKLGSSVSPIFTAFSSMEELHEAIVDKARMIFDSYLSDAIFYSPAFKRLGMQMIHFAQDEPQLFRILFMSRGDAKENFADALEKLTSRTSPYVEIVQDEYKLDKEQAYRLFTQLWIHTYGIGVMCATGVCTFSEEEISDMLSEVFAGMLMVISKNKGTQEK